jgi:hypothetical protein
MFGDSGNSGGDSVLLLELASEWRLGLAKSATAEWSVDAAAIAAIALLFAASALALELLAFNGALFLLDRFDAFRMEFSGRGVAKLTGLAPYPSWTWPQSHTDGHDRSCLPRLLLLSSPS